MKAKVLFVCMENSCRSQISEGFARKLGGNVLEAWSAGSKPSGKVNEKAIAVMQERGIDLSRHTSKGLADLPPVKWDYVITMGCGDACPFVPSRARLDWQIPDPKNMALPEFRQVCDFIEQKIQELIDELSQQAS